MSSKKGPSKGSASGTRDRPYRVGHGKPPAEHQFRPGQSGHPQGRPKGSKNTNAILKSVLDQKIEIRVKGRLRLISVREAIITRFAEDALKGNTKSAAFLLQRYDMPESSGDQPSSVLAEEEQEIIDAYLNSHLKTKGTKG
jgi:hypothetical protein